MSSRLPSAWLDELRSHVSIEEIVGERVQLKRKGRYLWACCPFHNEKTPSFKVDTDSQMFYCFGCHKGGNVIGFVMEYDHLEFMEAVELLADRAHMPMPDRLESTVTEDRNRQLREKIYEANLLAARFFHQLIWKPEGSMALKYLYSRGLTDSDIRRFGLGASPHGGDTLYRALKEAGFDDEVIDAAWLCGQRDGRRYDMFRERVIFPILNPQGKVLGFGGRIMGDGNPKYLNTSDTPVFNKRNGLYALNFARKEHGLKRLVLVEGYMDTVSLLKYGIPGVVATLGTALTEEQARLMKRYAPEVWISYDGDGAGRKAALRALDILGAQGVPARVIDYPGGMDPDEFVRANGAEAWNGLKKIEPAEYRMMRARDGMDISVQEDRTQYTIRCCEILRSVQNPVELENYLQKLAHDTGYSRDVLLRQIGQSAPPKAEEAPRPRTPAVAPKKHSVLELAQMQLIALLCNEMIPADMLMKDDFDTGLYADIYEDLAAGMKVRDFIGEIPEEQRQDALEAINYDALPESKEKALDFAEGLLHRIRQIRLNNQINMLNAKINTASAEEKRQLLEQTQALLAKLD